VFERCPPGTFAGGYMSFRLYTNLVSQASRNIAIGCLTIGLLLIGFGVLIIAFAEIFVLLAAVVFFIVGAGFAVTALKIYLAQRRFDKQNREPEVYRDNVSVRIEDRDF
jgi:membrane protein implicated in regulation of membrane protease activity